MRGTSHCTSAQCSSCYCVIRDAVLFLQPLISSSSYWWCCLQERRFSLGPIPCGVWLVKELCFYLVLSPCPFSGVKFDNMLHGSCFPPYSFCWTEPLVTITAVCIWIPRILQGYSVLDCHKLAVSCHDCWMFDQFDMQYLMCRFRKLAELGYSRGANKCKEKFNNICKYHKRIKNQATRSQGKAYQLSNQLEAPDIHPSPPPFSSGSTMHEKSGNHKRKWNVFLEDLMEQMVRKQEIFENDFLKTLEKLDQERMAKEEAWKMQILEERKRQHEIQVQERLAAAARNATIIRVLEKITDLHNVLQPTDGSLAPEKLVNSPELYQSQNSFRKRSKKLVNPLESDNGQDFNKKNSRKLVKTMELDSCQSFNRKSPEKLVGISEYDIGQNSLRKKSKKLLNTPELDNDRHSMKKSRSRWPKEDVHALIVIRSTLERVYHGNIPKGSMWEEISSAMKKVGCYRSAKRCKEKWENINKYFKKVKESNRVPEISKRCSYIHQLETLHKEKTERVNSSVDSCPSLKGEDLVMYIIRESQLLVRSLEQEQASATEDCGSKKDDHCCEEDGNDENLDGDAGDEDQILSNRPSSTGDAE